MNDPPGDRVPNAIRPWRIGRNCCAACAAVCLLVASLRADSPKQPEDGDQPAEARNRNLTMKTLGGRQYWSDVEYFRGFRIQKRVTTGHYRLLDEDDYRLASGTLDECRRELQEIRMSRHLPPMSGKAVILVHGIGRSSKSMKKMRSRLEQKGYLTFGFDYPSTRVEISEAADSLDDVIHSLNGVEEIDFVVHSMGGLVVRSYLKRHGDDRIKRMVMIGTPNRGAQLADVLKSNPLYDAILGPAGEQLGSDPAGYVAGLPTPTFEFAVIAGGRGSDHGFNPFLPGDNDGTVSVASAMLPGAADSALVPSMHTWLLTNDTVIDYTARFLLTGRLREDGARQAVGTSQPVITQSADGSRPRRAKAAGESGAVDGIDTSEPSGRR